MPLLHNVYLSQPTYDALTAIKPEIEAGFGSASDALEHVIKRGIEAAQAELNAAAFDAANASQPA